MVSVTVAAMTAAGLGMSASPAAAAASKNSDWSYALGCSAGGSGHGRFEHKGDLFKVTDMCHTDGKNVVLVADYEGNNAIDFVLWDTTANSGEYKKERVNLPEGRKVEIRVCRGDKVDQEYWDCGASRIGYA
jgi:hypothetical protein